ncbi:MAG: hypothetical protein WAV13_00360 [Thermodesulfovibrionales bacterium]
MKTNTDMTIYNKYVVAGVETYKRTQIIAVQWENRKGANVLRTGGTTAADQVAVFIPWARGANYLKPKAWQALADKTGKWTLQVGDFIVKGLVADEIGPGFLMSALKAKYDDVLAITSIDTMDQGSQVLWHWQLGAK